METFTLFNSTVKTFLVEKWPETSFANSGETTVCEAHFCKSNLNKTGVINDSLVQTHSHASSEYCFLLVCYSRLEKWGWTDGQHVRKQ